MGFFNSRNHKSMSQMELGFAEIEDLLQSLFGNREKLLAAKAVSEGDVNSCYIIRTSLFREKLFLKVENESIPKFYDGQVAKEVMASKLLKNANVPTPEVIAYEINRAHFQKRYMITKFIEGETLSKIWSKLDPFQKYSVKVSCIELIQKFKSIASDYFGDIYEDGIFGRHKRCKEAFIKMAEVALYDCLVLGSLTEEEANIINEACEKSLGLMRSTQNACFNHMDLHWDNIIVAEDGGEIKFKAILDFGSSIFGPAYSDEVRISKGFLYMTEDFYGSEIKMPEKITPEDRFSAQLLSALDYYVFLTLMGDFELQRQKLINMCEGFLRHP